MDRWILMILTYIIDIDVTVKLTQGQGHKVKGQGHICIYSKILFRLKIQNTEYRIQFFIGPSQVYMEIHFVAAHYYRINTFKLKSFEYKRDH